MICQLPDCPCQGHFDHIFHIQFDIEMCTYVRMYVRYLVNIGPPDLCLLMLLQCEGAVYVHSVLVHWGMAAVGTWPTHPRSPCTTVMLPW